MANQEKFEQPSGELEAGREAKEALRRAVEEAMGHPVSEELIDQMDSVARSILEQLREEKLREKKEESS